MARLLLLDPSCLLTQRGVEWLDRAGQHGELTSVAASRSCWEALISEDSDTLRPWLWAFRSRVLDRVRTVSRVPLLLCAPAYHQTAGAPVLRELIGGLADGGILVARRPPTFDQMVEAGIEVHVGRSVGFSELMPDLEACLPVTLIESLVRRVRFAACVSEGRTGTVEDLRVYDQGRSAFR